jgi:hypothetical protein
MRGRMEKGERRKGKEGNLEVKQQVSRESCCVGVPNSSGAAQQQNQCMYAHDQNTITTQPCCHQLSRGDLAACIPRPSLFHFRISATGQPVYHFWGETVEKKHQQLTQASRLTRYTVRGRPRHSSDPRRCAC